MTRDSAYLRGQLASVGILLDEPARPLTGNSAAAPTGAPVDRELIREILVDAHAPANDLEWLTASCSSVEAAREYRAPARQAWCFDCDSAQPTDAAGCLTCRERTA